MTNNPSTKLLTCSYDLQEAPVQEEEENEGGFQDLVDFDNE